MIDRIHRRLPTDCVLPSELDFVSIFYDKNGYRIRVSEFAVASPDIYEIYFGTGLLAQRSMDEGSYLSMAWTVDETDGPVGPVVLVDNSDFLGWFHEQSRGVYSKEEVKHVAVLTQNEWIEVLCLKPPEVSLLTSHLNSPS